MPQSRSLPFRERQHNRYWWYRLRDTDFIPLVFSSLSDDEWDLMDAWFNDTEKKFPSPGEISIPGISLLTGLISGSGVGSVVQCGHYVGYSTLLLGFLFRRMGKKHALFSIDIDPDSTEYAQSWIRRAGLEGQVLLTLSSSSDPALPAAANAYFGNAPQIVFIDSSHQYAHTKDELDLWWKALAPGGLIVMHDVSVFAKIFDSTGQGGVQSAVMEWANSNGAKPFLMNSFVTDQDANSLVYKDGCGMGFLQKPM